MQRTALASDIDGTLVFYESENFTENAKTYIKEEDLAAVAAWQARGGLFGLCSGRSVAGVFDLLLGNIKPDFYIACSGAAIFDRDRNVIYEAVIEKDEIRAVFEKYKDTTSFDAFHTDSTDTRYRTIPMERPGEKEVLVKSLDDIGDRKLYSVSLIFENSGAAEEACRAVNENCPALEGFQNKNSIDIVKKGCSKGQGILFVKDYLKIDVMAGIGDSFNDMPMLMAAHPSFTFHNSPEAVRGQVTHVVGSVAEALRVLQNKGAFSLRRK